MKTATVREIRHDFSGVMALVEAGESVQISKHGNVIAVLSPPPARPAARKRKRPDFLGRLKQIYGDKPLPGENPVLEDRQASEE